MNDLDLVATITSLKPACFRKNDIYMRMHAWGPSRINRQNMPVIDHMSVLLYGVLGQKTENAPSEMFWARVAS